ncbi:phospholipase D family protein [Chryseolinea sp. H1M3-3]|uniref:phospholipase D family protein n=1 Tax=Chryseolinea sp. H1M3-3 TaxID=3034144 RepID=UPI0023EC2222|nr:phospholipase D family protein [Chryseolinea sp. H1M3-3]
MRSFLSKYSGNVIGISFSILWIIFIVSGCSPDQPKYIPISEDYCAKMHLELPSTLSHQLASLSTLMSSKTGVYTLEEGDASMISRAWLCESAERTLDIQYFIFSADNIGLIASDYLLRAADRGIHVRVIVDDVMVDADADDLLALDAHPNLSIKIYNPTANIGKNLSEKLYNLTTNFTGFNQRMHNKTFIVDGEVVITGGRNIADEYFDYDHEYNFRDRDVLLIGKTSRDVQKSFNLFWDSKLSVPITQVVNEKDFNLNTEVKYDYLHQYACNSENFWPQVREKIKAMPAAFRKIVESGDLVWVDHISFVSDLPGKNNGDEGLQGGGVCTDSLINLIKKARTSIDIQSPYLITTALSQQLFREAVMRGVRVNILTNSLSSTDNLEAFSGYRRERETLLNIGINIYEFKPDAACRFKIMTGALQKKINYTPIFGLHAKSIVIDHEIAVIGTFNLDPRSANLNTECVAIIYDPKIAKDLFNAMQEDIKPENAWNTTISYNPDSEAGWLKKTKVWFRGVVPKSIL